MGARFLPAPLRHFPGDVTQSIHDQHGSTSDGDLGEMPQQGLSFPSTGFHEAVIANSIRAGYVSTDRFCPEPDALRPGSQQGCVSVSHPAGGTLPQASSQLV